MFFLNVFKFFLTLLALLVFDFEKKKERENRERPALTLMDLESEIYFRILKKKHTIFDKHPVHLSY